MEMHHEVLPTSSKDSIKSLESSPISEGSSTYLKEKLQLLKRDAAISHVKEIMKVRMVVLLVLNIFAFY